MGAAILRGDHVAIAVTGKRRVDQPEPLQTGDAFHLGSDTKAMTASVVARLVDRHVLRWNLTLAEALPALADKIDPAFRSVTLEMLMRHTAGLSAGGAFTPEFTAGFDESWPVEHQRAWMTERFLTRAPPITPGTKFSYSNYGYLVLGHVLEHATHKPWEQLVREEVFDMLGMTGCGFGPTASAEHPDGNWAHDVKDGAYVPIGDDNPQFMGPAATVYCPLAAWARFAAAHAGVIARGWISPTAMEHLHTGVTLPGEPIKDIGLGWGVSRTKPTRLTHGGSNGWNDARIVVIPSLQAAVLVTVNAGDQRARDAGDELTNTLVERLLASRSAAIALRMRRP